jgi:transcriptional regulator with XRE-family HTH domain
MSERVNVRAIRARLKLTQEEFAGRFGISIHTLRRWEQGSREPEGPARTYLRVIDQEPEAVQRALSAYRAAATGGLDPESVDVGRKRTRRGPR